jgi:hypothetical protein
MSRFEIGWSTKTGSGQIAWETPPLNLSFMQGADGAFEADASPGARGWLAAR